HKEVIEPTEPTVPIQGGSPRVAAHTYRAHRVRKGADPVMVEAPGAGSAEHRASGLSQRAAGGAVAPGVAVRHRQTRQPHTIGTARINHDPVAELRLILGDGEQTGEVSDHARAQSAERAS